MTQVIPADNHPLRMQSELPRFRNTLHSTSNKAEYRTEQQKAIEAFLGAGGSIQVLPGFPEKIDSNAVGFNPQTGW